MTTIAPTLERYEYSQVHMGVRVVLTLYAPNSNTAESAATAAYAKFAELEAIMSDYRQDSELMLLCKKAGQGPQTVSADLYSVVERAQRLAAESNGAFDITCSPYVRLWREARKTKKMPTQVQLDEARKVVGYQNISLADGKVSLLKPGMLLDLGGIAKGYACDKAIEVMKAHNIDRAMCEAGGDIVASGAPPGKLGWKIAVRGVDSRLTIDDSRNAKRKTQNDASEIWLKNAAVSTSGDAYQFVTIGRKRYSHIVDPRTGIGLTNRKQVTIIAKDGITTDSLATALCILDDEQGAEVARKYDARFLVMRGK